MELITISLPQYIVDYEPEHKVIGKIVDDEIKRCFMGQTVLVRGLDSAAHPGKLIDELVEIIKQTGTDRYDPERTGDRYDNIQGKHIDLFALRRKVTSKMELFKHLSWGFYHGSIAIHGKPTRLNILIIYDASLLKAITHQYKGRDDIKRDGYVFRSPDNKAAAVLGVVKLT